jgi:hypothetical protein
MPRPKKNKPTCNTCGREFNRKQNLEWHLPIHDVSGADLTANLGNVIEAPSLNKEDQLSEGCTECHTKEHALEKKDDQINQLTQDLSAAATRLRQPQEPDGHKDIQSLLDCPGCGSDAIKKFEKSGGAVLPPGVVKPKMIEYVKKNFPIFEKGIEIPSG